MSELVQSSAFGIALTVLAYWVGVKIQKKTGLVICNSVILATILIIAVLSVFHIPVEAYNQGGSIINLFLGPITICLATMVYTKIDLLKKQLLPILMGCLAGAVASIVSVFLMCRLFGFEPELTAAMLPKSVTTPIAMAIAQANGGVVSITAVAVIFTGMLGNLMAPLMIRVFHVRDPLAAGLGIGACSHAMGTAKALELGETEGAMSSLAIGLCGIFTSLAALLFPLIL
ncbi:MAG: LrgB family protein [Oscillibacter sp.]|jgi:predicted murein hydrolase (TIGR00659 family)|nr:LrgB family protein [Oscillibacter sp.]